MCACLFVDFLSNGCWEYDVMPLRTKGRQSPTKEGEG